MKRLALLGVVLLSILVVMVLTSKQFGTALSRPEFARLFTYPDGSPCKQSCLLGIVPNQTSLADAIQLVQTHPISRTWILEITVGTSNSPVVFTTSSGRFWIIIDSNHRIIDVHWQTDRPNAASAEWISSFTAADVMSVLGTPNYANFGGYYYDVYYQRQSIVAGFLLKSNCFSCLNLGGAQSNQRISPNDLLTDITVGGVGEGTYPTLWRWQGFKP
jgi:hypothetical protein